MLSKRMNLFALFYILVIAVCAIAQPSVQPVEANEPILQDSLETDSLSKISLALDVDTSGFVDTNKVESIDAGVEGSSGVKYEYFPDGFYMEIAYHAPSVIQVPFFWYKE